jgi:ubiquinone/menaquinone biosynthesis C-methylase UbiE
MPDPYTNPDAQAASTIQAMMTRLEERGRHIGFSRMIAKYVGNLPKRKPLVVLDLGCGTGVVTRQLDEVLHPDSTVHGADVSSELLREAARLAGDSRIKWDYLSAGALPYPDQYFDVITMHTLLSHVPDPECILTEARRVLRPDGQLIVFDADHASTTYAQPDYQTTRRVDFLLTSAIATHPDICRRLPTLLKQAGYELTAHDAEVISECGKGDYWLSSVQGFARLIPTLGVLTPAEADAWIRHMMESHDEGTFFAAGAFYTFYAKPSSQSFISMLTRVSGQA